MIAWLYGILIGNFCHHKWKILREIQVFDLDVSREMPAHRKYVLQCEICGNLKKRKA